jgi:hypothetical protein
MYISLTFSTCYARCSKYLPDLIYHHLQAEVLQSSNKIHLADCINLCVDEIGSLVHKQMECQMYDSRTNGEKIVAYIKEDCLDVHSILLLKPLPRKPFFRNLNCPRSSLSLDINVKESLNLVTDIFVTNLDLTSPLPLLEMSYILDHMRDVKTAQSFLWVQAIDIIP